MKNLEKKAIEFLAMIITILVELRVATYKEELRKKTKRTKPNT